MNSEQWRKVADVDALEIGEPVLVKGIDDEEIALIKTEDGIFAIGHECPHYGGPLDKGEVCDNVVTCPYHNARFDIRSGEMLTPPALDNVPQYPTKIEDGKVYVGRGTTKQIEVKKGGDRSFVIIGGGAAGNAAAEMLRRAGFDGRVVMITAEDRLPYDRPNLSKAFLSGDAKAGWLPLRGQDFYENIGVETMLSTTIESVDRKNHSMKTSGGEVIRYDKLLLATGSAPKQLPDPSLKWENIYYLRNVGDAKRIIEAAESAKSALVLGASFIGMEVASSLRARGIEVHVVAPEEIPFSLILGKDVGRRFQQLHESNDVQFHMGLTAKEIFTNSRERVVLSDGSEVEVDLVAAGLGVAPVVEFLQGSGLIGDGGVPVDSALRTEDRDIYAAGDIAEFPDPVTEEKIRIEHWILAQMHGRHAALSMLGEGTAFTETPFFWTRQFGTSFKYIGYPLHWDRVETVGGASDDKFLIGYFENDILRGAASLGMQSDLVEISEIMRGGTQVSKDRFKEVTGT